MSQGVAGDTAGYFADINSARAYASGSNPNTTSDYHKDRMRALRLLVEAAQLGPDLRVLDFGCGDGMYFTEFFTSDQVSKIVGVDLSEPMVQLAAENLRDFAFEGKAGGVDALQRMDGQFDLGLAIDVLGYLSDDDLDIFYTEMARLIRPGGRLIVMYGNELFDMYALNSGTAAFFAKHFGHDVADLLVEGQATQYKPVGRKNPLSYGAEIARYGFRELRQAFSQWHKMPPAIGNRAQDVGVARLEMRDHQLDPNQLAPQDGWQAFFRASIFASLSERRTDV